MATTKQGLSTRAQNGMARRLRLLSIAAQQGRKPTVAQISAAYSTMSVSPLGYGEELWGELLALAEQAIGVLDTCCHCGGRGQISQPIGNGELGFTQKTCAVYEQGMVVQETCHGTGVRRVHNPAPGELPGNLSMAHAQATNYELLTKLLGSL